MSRKSVTLVERFEKFVEPVTESGCHLWTGHVGRDGYGTFKIDGRSLLAHRVSYEIYVGEIPSGAYVCHSCDIPCCVNPNHLWAGSQLENVRDRDEKGRRIVPSGEENWNSKLTNAAVVEIRDKYAAGGVFQRELAEQYGVSDTLIGYVINRKIWTHV